METTLSTNTLTLCFGCDQGRLNGAAIFDLPSEWKGTLREFFTTRGIPIRTIEQYGELWAAPAEETAPADDGAKGTNFVVPLKSVELPK